MVELGKTVRLVDLSKTVRIVPPRIANRERSGVDLDLRDLAPRAELKTEVLDFSRDRELHAQLLALCSGDGAVSPARAVETAPPAVETSPPIVAPNLTSTLVLAPKPTELDRTIYDGGALRDYAFQLSAKAEQVANAGRAPGSFDPAPPAGTRSLRLPAVLRWWRAASPARRVLWACLILANAGLGVSKQIQRRQQPDPVSAARIQRPGLAVTRGTDATATSATPVAAVSATATSTHGAVTLPHPESRPSPALGNPPAAATGAAAAPPLARAALHAAFDGNKREAIAAYERLGAGPGGELFTLAARLVREDQVRRP